MCQTLIVFVAKSLSLLQKVCICRKKYRAVFGNCISRMLYDFSAFGQDQPETSAEKKFDFVQLAAQTTIFSLTEFIETGGTNSFSLTSFQTSSVSKFT